MPLALSPQDRQNLGLTIAGEIDPGLTAYGTEAARQEMAAIMGVVENRSMLSNKSISQTVKSPNQFTTWSDAGKRKTAATNYAQNKAAIDEAIAAYEAGTLTSPVPNATHYWSPVGMLAITNKQRAAPSWAKKIDNQTKIGPHVFGTERGMLTKLQEARMFANLNPPTPTSRPSYVDPAFAAYAEASFSRNAAPTSPIGMNETTKQSYAQMAESLSAAGLIGLDGRTPYSKDKVSIAAPSAARFGYAAPGLSMPSPERFGYAPKAAVNFSGPVSPAAPASRSALSMPSPERFGYTKAAPSMPSPERFGYAPSAAPSGPVSSPAAAKADRLGSPASRATPSAPASQPSASRFGYSAPEPAAARFGYDTTAKGMVSPSGPVSAPAAAKTDRLGQPSAPASKSSPAAGYVDKSVNPSNPGQLGGVTMSNPVGLGGPGGLYVGAPPSQPGMPAAPAKAAPAATVAPSVTVSAPKAPKAAVAISPPAVDRSTKTASTPAAPRASAMDVYSGKAAQGIDNTGKNTVTRDALGNISVTNSYGVTTTTSPQGFSTTSRGMPAAPSIGAPEEGQKATSGLSMSGLSKGIGGKITSGIKGLDTPQAKGTIAGAILGGLVGGVPGAIAGARIGSGLGKKMGTVQYNTPALGKLTAAAPRGGYGFPSAPTGTTGALGGKQSNNSAEGMRGISPGAAAAIGRGQGGLY